MSAPRHPATLTEARTRDARAAWALTAPALMLFVGVLVIPLAMTVMLSFHDWGQYKGIEPVFILKNWHEIATDPYYCRDVLADLPHRVADDADHRRASARRRPTSSTA